MQDINHHKVLRVDHKPYFVKVDDHVRKFYKENYKKLKADTKRVYISRTYTSQYDFYNNSSTPIKTLEDLIRDIGPKEKKVKQLQKGSIFQYKGGKATGFTTGNYYIQRSTSEYIYPIIDDRSSNTNGITSRDWMKIAVLCETEPVKEWEEGYQYMCIAIPEKYGKFTVGKTYRTQYREDIDRYQIVCEDDIDWDIDNDRHICFVKIKGSKVQTTEAPAGNKVKFPIGTSVKVDSLDRVYIVESWDYRIDEMDVLYKLKGLKADYKEDRLALAEPDIPPIPEPDEGWSDGDWEKSNIPPNKSATGAVPDPDDWGQPKPATEKEIPAELRDLGVKEEAKAMIEDFPILFEGPVGSGKTTIIMELADEYKQELVVDVMTRQTTVNMLMGYKNVNGDYISSKLRDAYEFGKIYLLEEINGGDPNVLLCLNTIENGFLSFPDKKIEAHKDFKMFATMNNITNSKDFSGRSVLDLSTRDRFHTIEVHTKYNDRFSDEVVALRDTVVEYRSKRGDTYDASPRDMRRYIHLSKKMSRELALKKTMLKGLAVPVTEAELRNMIKKSENWK